MDPGSGQANLQHKSMLRFHSGLGVALNKVSLCTEAAMPYGI